MVHFNVFHQSPAVLYDSLSITVARFGEGSPLQMIFITLVLLSLAILSTITYLVYSHHCPHYHHGSLSGVVLLGIWCLSEVVALPGKKPKK